MTKLIDINGLKITEESLKEYIQKSLKEQKDEQIVSEDSYLKFPRVGNDKTIYIDTTTNYTYRFDENDLKYFIIGTNYNDIEIIDGN